MTRYGLIVVQTVLLVLESIGLWMAFSQHGLQTFLFYTYDSNILGWISTVCLLVYLIYCKGNVKKLHHSICNLRLLATTSMEVTFIVVLFLFVPAGLFSDAGVSGSFSALMLEGDGLYLHFLCPLLSLISYFFLENPKDLKLRDTFLVFQFSVLYTVILVILNLTRVVEGPYSFFLVYQQPVWLSVLLAVLMMGGNYGLTAANYFLGKWTSHRTERKLLDQNH